MRSLSKIIKGVHLISSVNFDHFLIKKVGRGDKL